MRFVGIDPSTKTGFVALDEAGIVIRAKELTGVGAQDPQRMVTMIEEIMAHLKQDDFICIEGFGYASQQAVQLGGIGWGIRMAMYRRGISYNNVAPDQVKKFVGVSGWTGEKGSKRRLKDKEKKAVMAEAVRNIYGFTHRSHNIVDAYVLAQIARNMLIYQKWPFEVEVLDMTETQLEVIRSILNPAEKKRKKVAK